MHFTRTKAALAGIIVTVAVSGVTFAFWTATGTGTGTAASPNGSAAALTLHAVFDGGLVLGESQTVTVKADGNGESDVSLGGSTLSFTVSTDHVGCTAADFTLPDATATGGVVVHAADTGVAVGSSTLTLLSRNVDQDACQGATVTVDVTAG